MDLDAKVDLTESRDFSNPYTFNEKVPKLFAGLVILGMI